MKAGFAALLGAMVLLYAVFAMTGCNKQEPDNVYVTVSPHDFSSLNVTLPSDCLLVAGVDIPLTAMAYFESNGYNAGTQDWTSRVTWSVSDTSIATISSSGVLRARQPGRVEVKVVSPEQWVSTRTLYVDSLIGLSLSADESIVLQDDSTNLSLSAVLSGNRTQPVPHFVPVEWHLTSPELASISNDRTLHGIHMGQTVLTATLAGCVSHPILMTVDSVLTLTCEGMSDSSYLPMDTIRMSAMAQLHLTGRMRVTDRVEWNTSHPSQLFSLGDGVFVPMVPGSFKVWARMGGHSSDSMSCDVWHVTSISISPDTVADTLRRNDTLQFTANAQVEGHGLQDLTDHVKWVSSNTMCGDFIAPGTFVAGATGIAEVRAEVAALRSPAVTVNVWNPALFFEGFEGYSTGPFYGDSRWNEYGYNGSYTGMSSTAASGSRSCLLSDSSMYGYCYLYSTTGTLPYVARGTLSLDVMTEGEGITVYLSSSGYNTAMELEFVGGTIYAETYSGWQTLQSYVTGQWYHVAFEFDCGTDTYNVMIDGMRRGNGLQFYNTANNIASVQFETSSSYSGNRTFLDNITIEN